jgi:hypothetical protein
VDLDQSAYLCSNFRREHRREMLHRRDPSVAARNSVRACLLPAWKRTKMNPAVIVRLNFENLGSENLMTIANLPALTD